MRTMRMKLVKINYLTGERIFLMSHENIKKEQMSKE